MAFLSLKTWRARSAEQAAQSARLKAEVGATLGLGPADAVNVNEIACPDPGCPDLETVVLVMRAGEPTRAFRIRKTVDGVDGEDLAALAADEAARRSAGTR
ncbi:hypothetical protein [Methylobacterium sp. A54F]